MITLKKLIFIPSTTVFHEMSDVLPRLSKDLKKPKPEFSVKGDQVEFTTEAINLISNVFTHLIRNSMDHGIEDEETRMIKGKPPIGSISIQVKADNSGLEIIYTDGHS